MEDKSGAAEKMDKLQTIAAKFELLRNQRAERRVRYAKYYEDPTPPPPPGTTTPHPEKKKSCGQKALLTNIPSPTMITPATAVVAA
jgi:hypothetical protein